VKNAFLHLKVSGATIATVQWNCKVRCHSQSLWLLYVTTEECSAVLLQKLHGVTMRCPNRECNRKKSVRIGSYFARGRLPIAVQMKMMCCFTSNVTVTATAKLLKLRRATVSQYFDNFRGEWLDNLRDEPIVFTDNGEYEVDECLIKHIWNPAAGEHQALWIGGILERATGKVLLYPLQSRSRHSLVTPILRHVPHGSFVYSDDWPSYRSLMQHEYTHLSVNHSNREYARLQTLGDETLNVHINGMEGLNREVRQRFANKSNRNLERVDLTLAEIMYRHSGRPLFWPFKI